MVAAKDAPLPVNTAPPPGVDAPPPVFSTGRTAAPRSLSGRASKGGSRACKTTPRASLVASPESAPNRQLKDECVCQEQQILTGKEVTMPGDGSCLFHSMAHGLGGGVTGELLRTQIVAFIKSHPDHKMQDGSSLSRWIKFEFEKKMTVQAYCDHMSKPTSWAGAIDIAVLAHLYDVRVIVGKMQGGMFHTLHWFKPSGTARKDVYLAYNGINHHNAFEPAGPFESAGPIGLMSATAEVKRLLGMSLSPSQAKVIEPAAKAKELAAVEAAEAAEAVAAATEAYEVAEAKAAAEAKAEACPLPAGASMQCGLRGGMIDSSDEENPPPTAASSSCGVLERSKLEKCATRTLTCCLSHVVAETTSVFFSHRWCWPQRKSRW